MEQQAQGGQEVVIVEWSPSWAADFMLKAAVLRRELGGLAMRIDHIGSTSITGMAAKPIIDIQISVMGFEPFDPLFQALVKAGYLWRHTNPELTKRYFREQPGAERTHVHMRRLGSWHEQWALLFRDYMRVHPDEQQAYASLKRQLAQRFGADREGYTAAKGDFFWQTMRRADEWAGVVGWRPGQPDA
jgi:GrpB-like predicted nucleotidyltransferase (UPF0157 family)